MIAFNNPFEMDRYLAVIDTLMSLMKKGKITNQDVYDEVLEYKHDHEI